MKKTGGNVPFDCEFLCLPQEYIKTPVTFTKEPCPTKKVLICNLYSSFNFGTLKTFTERNGGMEIEFFH